MEFGCGCFNNQSLGGYKSYQAAKKPWLRIINRVKRPAWARNHLNWTPAQWRSVLWSDESKFEVRSHGPKKWNEITFFKQIHMEYITLENRAFYSWAGIADLSVWFGSHCRKKIISHSFFLELPRELQLIM
jgi:hypothetical protein